MSDRHTVLKYGAPVERITLSSGSLVTSMVARHLWPNILQQPDRWLILFVAPPTVIQNNLPTGRNNQALPCLAMFHTALQC